MWNNQNIGIIFAEPYHFIRRKLDSKIDWKVESPPDRHTVYLCRRFPPVRKWIG